MIAAFQAEIRMVKHTKKSSEWASPQVPPELSLKPLSHLLFFWYFSTCVLLLLQTAVRISYIASKLPVTLQRRLLCFFCFVLFFPFSS